MSHTYTLSEEVRLSLLVEAEAIKTSVADDVAESAIQKTLPLIPGLEGSADEVTRQEIYSKMIAAQRASFILANGSPFGDVEMAELGPVESSLDTFVRFQSVVAA